MNRRSFFSRTFSAIVAVRMARELSAAPFPEIPTPGPEPMEYEIVGGCPSCTHGREILFGGIVAIYVDRPCEQHSRREVYRHTHASFD